MDSKVIFVTGTDTGIGKTTVSSMLVERLAQMGLSVAVCKPVETGVQTNDAGEFVPADASELLRVSSAGQALGDVCFHSFEEPVAPSVAFSASGEVPNVAQWLKKIRELEQASDLVLIEGAGGVMVPLIGAYSFLDLIADARWPTLVVAGSKLGGINHFSLTLEALAKRSAPILGYVFNELFAESEDSQQYSLAHRTNRDQFALVGEHYNVQELTMLPYLSGGGGCAKGKAAERLSQAVLMKLGIEISTNESVVR